MATDTGNVTTKENGINAVRSLDCAWCVHAYAASQLSDELIIFAASRRLMH
jgi:hypothetical protein